MIDKYIGMCLCKLFSVPGLRFKMCPSLLEDEPYVCLFEREMLPVTQGDELWQGNVRRHFHRGFPVVPRILEVRHCVAKALNLHLEK